MLNYIINLNPIIQALIAGIFTWSITSLGAIVVFILKKENQNIMDIMLSTASGVMVAASFFSLLLPAIEMANNLNMIAWLVTSISLLLGGILIILSTKIFTKINKKSHIKESNLKRCMMLITSITIHNIPEGLAIGVAFGSTMYNLDNVTLLSAWMLALGIGIQNFPEGAAVSLPLIREGYSKKKAFLYGQASALVEPIASFIGALVVIKMRYLLPYLLAFAAGSMLFVVAIELIPESQKNKNKNLMAIFFLIGFSIMMILDISLG